MLRSFKISAIFGVLCTLAAHAHSVRYSNEINPSSWSTHTSVFECRLEHNVPYYGDAVFRTRAGEASAFYLRASTSRFQAGTANVIAKSPVWKSKIDRQELGRISVKRGKRPLWLDSKHAENYLSQLYQGRELKFIRPTWYHDEKAPAMDLVVKTIGFREAYDQYLSCLAGLLPRNFEQMRRTALYYSVGDTESEGLSDENIKSLEYILALVKHDNKIRKFYIDGHASSPGDRADNLELSKGRAEIVAEWLRDRGVPDDWMVVRWHGERYPVASNATRQGRAQNRRVTVRIERIEEVEVLPLAQNKGASK